jgi:long-chain acyl-CoA synthetase
MKRSAMTVLLCLWLVSGARAATLEGVTMPDRFPVAGQSLALNGIGLRTLTVFRVRVYVAALYLTAPSHDAQAILASSEPKALVLQFLHTASKEQIERQYRAGEANNCGQGECAKSDEADFEKLVAATPPMEVGDTLIFEFTGAGVQVYAGQKLIGDFANKDLAFRLLSGFIGAHPPSDDLKRALLGMPPG